MQPMAAAGDRPLSGQSSPVPDSENEDDEGVPGGTRRAQRLRAPFRGETDGEANRNPVSDEEQFRLYEATTGWQTERPELCWQSLCWSW